MTVNRLAKIKKRYEESQEDEIGLGQLISSDIRNLKSNFDYDSLEMEIEDKNFLIEYEKNLILQGKRIGEIACAIGETLENARDVFKRYSTEEEPINFAAWYKAMGFNKDQVYLFRGRFKLTLERPEYKENILKLSDATIKEAINKKTPETIVKKVLEGELKTAKEVKEERKRTLEVDHLKSRALDLGNETIQDAEIIEIVEDITIKQEINLLEIEKRILKVKKNLKNLSNKDLKRVNELLKSLENIVNN
ncbi:hypothetical protein [Candidatus Cetobacterium colombiensis]|uniref:Uncharacterized protein n=1 Tax=Candidatus Cetobacterium colombiensis TaxID=3073100 RepID=A0ABU4WBH1_9FUSO|nr:hypothetical protein [Candidatus Cetobacterium colombiensis]MDX8336896.1 hypothetical protein [Candidatus Cetobacterium colombiensis]